MRFLMVICVMLGLAGPVMAQSVPALLAAGKDAEARALLVRMVGTGPKALPHHLYMDAMILMRAGKRDQAIRALREVLAKDPNFGPARVDLVRLLATSGQIDAALYHAERVARNAPDKPTQAEMTRFISRFQGGNRQGIALRFAVEPSSNINRGSGQESFALAGRDFSIEDSSQAQSGISVSAGVTGWITYALSDRWSLRPSLSIDGRTYREVDQDDQITLSGQLGLVRTGARHRLSFGPAAERYFKNGDGYRTRVGVVADVSVQAKPDLRLSFAAAHYDQRHDDEMFRDGTYSSLSAGLAWVLRPDVQITGRLSGVVEETERAHLDHTDLRLDLGVTKEWSGGLITRLGVSHGTNRFKGDFPLFTAPRKDHVSEVSLSVLHRKVQAMGFAPQLTLTGTKSRSNIPFYTYDGFDVGVALSRRF